MDQPKERTSRSRTGCLTCRKRKKKCDELLFPICGNCHSKLMVCEWPQLKLDLFDKIKEVKYVNEKGTTRKSHNNLKGVVGSGELRHKINKPWVLPGKRNTYLDRIAMQQDIEETSVTDSKQSVPVRQDLDLRYDPKLRYDVNLRQHAKLQQDPKLQQDALMTQDVPLKQDVSEELILEKYTFLRNGSSDRFTATHNDMS